MNCGYLALHPGREGIKRCRENILEAYATYHRKAVVKSSTSNVDNTNDISERENPEYFI